jgi:hypothetical protein
MFKFSGGPGAARRRLDAVFFFHAVASLISGAVMVAAPHSMVAATHGVHALVRVYGALVLAQGWLVFRTRRVTDAFVRKTMCEAYFTAFLLSTLVLLRAQLAAPEEHTGWDWLNVAVFFALTVMYGWFLFAEKLAVFESLDRAVK